MPISGITAEQLAEHIAAYERHETFHDFEYQTEGLEGVIQHYSVSGTPVFNERGIFIGYRGVGRNITELRLAEIAVMDSERRLAQIVDGSPIPTFVIDTDHRVTHWNQACANLTGHKASQMLGSKDAGRAFYAPSRFTLADFLVSGSMALVTAEHYSKLGPSALIAGAFEAESFFPNIDRDGRWLYLTAAPLRNSDGQLIGALETLQDITEQRRSQQFLEVRVAERTAELSQQLHFLQQLIEAIPGPVFYKDAKLRYLGCNRAFETFSGLPASALIGKTPSDIAPAELADKYLAADQKLLDQPGAQIYESKVRYADGEMRDVMFHKATFTLPDGSVGGIVGLMLDISGRKRMEESLRQAATVFENSTEGVTITSPDGSIIAVNRAFTEITGYEASEVIGRHVRLLQSGRHGKDFYREMWKEIAHRDRWQGEIWDRRKNGELFPTSISISAVRDNEGRVTHYVSTFSDITQRKRSEEEIQRLAFSDALTGLPNRRLLLDRLQQALMASSHNKHHGAVYLIDLDDFKDLNDTLGHDKGDQLLLQVAQRLVGCIREGDTVARLGGDEFVVLLEELSENLLEATGQIELVGNTILATLNQPYMLQDYYHHSTPSIGVTVFGDHQHTSVDELLKQADLAMYQAKRSGRNALRFFETQMQNAITARLSMVADLRQGITKEQFILYYQPQIDFRGRASGAEALLRWRHPQRGMVSPAEFIPLAEDTGLILSLGRWVLDTACNQLRAWAKRPETAHLTLSVNVSVRQFRQLDFVDQVLAALACYDTPPPEAQA